MMSVRKRIILRSAAIILVVYMLSFASCDSVPICWYCENPHNSNDWQQVCNAMTKSKLESYGYVCTPF
ncbi:MAG: hypothetical protein QUS66_08515 [Bacteroidota bacterium]|nr:hypothetical protein [Bacteroidota bacterium]